MPEAKVLAELELPVESLPQGEYRDMLYPRVADPSNTNIWVVVLEQWGTLHVYAGFPRFDQIKPESQNETMEFHCSRIHSRAQVIELGNRLNHYEGRALFPALAERIGKK